MEKIKSVLLFLLMVILLAGCGNPTSPINSETYETATDNTETTGTTDSGNNGTDTEIITDADNEETGITDSDNTGIIGNEETDDENNEAGITDSGNTETDNNEITDTANEETDDSDSEVKDSEMITDNETGNNNEETDNTGNNLNNNSSNNNTNYSYLYEYNYVNNRYYYYDLNADMTIFYGEWRSSDGMEKFIFNNDGSFIYEKNENTITGKYGTLNSGMDFYGEVNNQIVFFCQFNFKDLNRLYLGTPNEGKLFEKKDDESDYNYLYDTEYISSGYYPDFGVNLNRFYGEWESSDGKEKFIFNYDDFIYEKNGIVIKGKYKTLNNGRDLYGENREYERIFWVPFRFIDSNTLYLGVENKGKLFEKLN